MIHKTDTGRTRPIVFAGTLAVVAPLVLAACGDASPVSGAGTTPAPQSSGHASRAGARGAPPATYGVIAAVDPADIQVQNPTTGQVTVRFTGTTRFTDTEPTTLAAVTAGSCVVATAPATSVAAPSSAPVPSPTAITATTVVLSPATSSGCLPRLAGRVNSGRSSGVPHGNRATRLHPRRPDAISGTVQSVSGSTFTVREPARGSVAAITATVTVTAATKYTRNVAVTAAALKVGLCATAMGKTDSTGTVTATRIALGVAGAGGCSPRFGAPGVAGLGGSGG